MSLGLLSTVGVTGGMWPTRMTLYSFKDSVSKHSHILRCWALGLQHDNQVEWTLRYLHFQYMCFIVCWLCLGREDSLFYRRLLSDHRDHLLSYRHSHPRGLFHPSTMEGVHGIPWPPTEMKVSGYVRRYRLTWCFAGARLVGGHVMFGRSITRTQQTATTCLHG